MNRNPDFFKEFNGVSVSRYFIQFLVGIMLLGVVSCTNAGQMSQAKVDDTTVKPQNSAENDLLEELYWARVDSAKKQFTQADVDFMIGMISHHAQALIMSDLAPKNNASSTIQTLASRIINAQKDEIQSMQKWLRDRNQSVPEVRIDGLILTIEMQYSEKTASSHQNMHHSGSGHSGPDHSGMPGMLTQKQLNELAQLEGEEFDQTFLTYMISHHTGALIMVENLFATDGAAQDNQAFRLASDIQVDQKTEIERMKQMLKELDS